MAVVDGLQEESRNARPVHRHRPQDDKEAQTACTEYQAGKDTVRPDAEA